MAGEGGFGRAVGCPPGGFSCQGGRGVVETWWGVPYTDESTLFCPDSSINNETKCERATGVPTWFGFPHHGNKGNMVVRVLVLLNAFVAVVGSSAQPSDQSA